MRSIAVAALFGSGCSFFLVNGPAQRLDVLPSDRSRIECTESSLIPLIDTIGGAAAITVAGVGVLMEQTSDDGEPENFTKYFAGPLVAGAIVYFIAASRGNTRVTWCSDANERLRAPGERVVPVQPDPRKPDQRGDPEDPLK